MKKIQITTVLAAAGVTAHAQTGNTWQLGTDQFMELMRAGGAILTLFLIGSFILYFTRQYLDYKLKKQMIARDIPQQILEQVTLSERKDRRAAALKWSLILAGLGLGFLFIGLFPPLGLHSLMIMAFCISLGFLLFYYFTGKQSA